MAKLTAWLVTLIGVLLVLDVIDIINVTNFTLTNLWAWIIALAILAVGIGKLIRNYKKYKK